MRSLGVVSLVKELLAGILLCLVVINGVNTESCKLGCSHSDSGLLKYAPGNVYEYSIESLMTVGSSANDVEETALKISGHAKLYAEANCGYTLQMDAVSVSAVKDSIDKQITHNLNKPVKFTMVNGELQPEICIEKSDSSASLNIKRAVISLLQASDKSHETDVFGVCPTLTSVSKAGASEVIAKIRNLNACSYREQISNGLINGIVNDKAGIKSSALLKADYSKELKLNKGIVENVQLVEEYKFAEVANGASIVKAKVKTTLKLENINRANAPQSASEGASIIFEHIAAPSIKNIGALKKVFINTVNLVNDHVQGDAAQYFTELIRLMRSSDVDTLIELSVVPHVNKELARKVYIDALLRVGTSSAVKAIVRQISKMSEVEKKMAFLSLNLVQYVDKDALSQAAALLNPSSPKEAFLAIGSLVNKYCKQGTCDQNDINIISKKFVDSLKHCKANTKKDEDRFVNILKGIRNTHKIADVSAQVLAECASPDRSARLRVAALQSFTAAPCNPGLQSKALNILRDHNEDSEIRIEAYLAAIACPNAQLSNEIAEIVNSEPVYQVGGFIASSLKAIRDSTDPTREAARHYLGNIRVTKKFPIDPRRYSFNSELSYAMDSLGIAASADYNLIYSQKGYLPRSARLNLTSEIFGTNFNVFEISARQENLEELFAYYFGPKGQVTTEGRSIVESLANKSRSKRSVVEESEKFSKKYKTYGSKANSDIGVDLAVRLFGSEMFFMSLADDLPQTADEIIAKFSQTTDKLKNGLKNFDHEYSCHALFLDTELVYPTGVGLPLELSAQGTSASKLSIATEIDIDEILEKPLKSKYRVKFVPSVDVSVNGQLRFNALVLSAGIRASTSLHSSTGEDQRFELTNEGHGFNLDIVFPRENLKLIEIKHNVEFVVAEQDKETKTMPLKSKKKKNAPQENCFDQLHYIGMTVCFTSILPETTSGDNTGFPLSGPVHIALRLQTEKKINILGFYEKNADSFLWKLKYSTPGSQVPHDTELNFKVVSSSPKVFVFASLQHPEIRLSAEAGVVNNNKEIVLYGQYDVNGDSVTQKIGLSKNGNEYRPLIEIQTNNGISNEINGVRADGRIIKQENGNNVRYTFDNFKIINKDGGQIVISGWTDTKPFRNELKVRHGNDEYDIKSHFSLEDGYSAGFFVRKNNSPYSNGASIDLQLSPNNINDAVVLAIGGYNFEMKNEFEYSREENQELKETKFKNQLKLKHKDAVMLKGTLNGEAGQKRLQFKLEAAKDAKKASFDLNFVKDRRAEGDYGLDVNAKLNQHFVDIKSNVEIKGVHYVTDNSLTTSWGTQLTAKGEIGQRLTSQDLYVDLEGSFLITAKDKKGTWLFKLIGNPDKTNCDFKLHRDNAELIAFSSETLHPQDKVASGKMNIQLKDLVGVKADFKINKGGKGDLTAVVNLKKGQRKINVDSKFIIASPKYDVETNIAYDNDKKLYLKTENIFDTTKISTKNILDINGDKFLFDANSDMKGEWRQNGEMDAKFSLAIPDGRKFDGHLIRKMSTAKNSVAHGTLSVIIGDKLPSNERRSIELNANIEKLNKKTNEFIGTNSFVYTNFAGKKLDATQKIKHLLKGNFKSIDYSLELGGELLTSPIDIAFIVDEYCPKHAVFRVSGKYGDHINCNLNGNYDMGDRGKPASYELQANIAAPQSNYKAFNLATSGKYLRPETEEGVRSIELHFNQHAGENTIKLNTIVKGNENHGSVSVDFASNKLSSPLKVDGSFSKESNEKEGGRAKYNINYVYGEKTIKSGLDISYVESKSGVLHYTLDSNLDSMKNNLDLTIRTKKIEDTFDVNSELTLNGQKYGLESVIVTNDHKKGITIKAVLPQKTTLISGVLEQLGERKGKIIISLANLGDLDFEYTGEANLNAFDDFYITYHTNSQKLKIDNMNFDIRAQGKSAGGKGVEINLRNAKGVIISGSATYMIKKEKSKVIVEGQGQIQYYQKTNSANFKIIHQLYDMASDQEVGYSVTFNGTFGPKNAVSTFKMTNKNFQAKLSVCEEKKQCTNVDIRSIITLDPSDVTSIQHDLMVLIDLRELGYPHEFELQSKSSRKGLKFNHEIESNIISNSNIKYQLVASMTPLLHKIQIKLPSREIYVETEQKFPKNILGQYQTSAIFYFDRVNKPNDVTKLIASADLSGEEKVAVSGKGEIRLEHPNIRSLSVSGSFDANYEKRLIQTQAILDIFKTPDQKIIASSTIKDINSEEQYGFHVTTENLVKSSGLGIQYEANAHSALSLNKFKFSSGFTIQSGVPGSKSSGLIVSSTDRFEIELTSMDEQLVKLLAEIHSHERSTKLDASLKIFALKPLNLVAEIETDSAKITLQRPGLIDASAEIKLGNEARFDIRNGKNKLFAGRLALDPTHFLASSIEIKEEDVKAFLKSAETTVNEDTQATKDHLQKRFQKIRESFDRQIELVKDSAPDLSALQTNIEENINAILKDLENDLAIKQIIDHFHKYYEAALKLYKDLAKTIGEAYKAIHASVKDLVTKIQTLIKDTVLPIWEEFAKKIASQLGELQVETMKLFTSLMEQLLKSLKSLEVELKAIIKPIYETLKPITDNLQDLFRAMAKEGDLILNDIKEYLSKLPSFEAIRDEIKHKIADMKAVDEILLFLRSIIDSLNSISTNELTEPGQKLYNYIEAKLRGTPVNDIEALEDVFNAILNAYYSIWKRLADIKPLKASFLAPVPMSIELLRNLPTLISFRFSVLNFIINEKVDELISLFDVFRPPFDFLPPFKLIGHIADGKNIFTFDGRQYSFKGSCRYMIVQDADKNDFSLIGTVKDGKLKALALIDGKNYLEIFDTGALKLNGRPAEYPVHMANVHAWRRYYTLRLRNQNGVEVTCTSDLKVCHVSVNGYYTSKTRGLLGNGNAEPYDDFITTDGKIASNNGEFVNDYGMGNCPTASSVESKNLEHDPICSELFSMDSSLLLGYLFMDPRQYRQACDEAVLASPNNKEEASCNIALTYASAAKLEKIPISLPNRCLKCTGPVGQREIDDEFSSKIPTNKADIIFVVDLGSSRNVIDNLVTPVITEIRNQLKTRSMTDAQIIVIAFSDNQLYPALLTSNGGKLNYNGKLSSVTLSGPARPEPLDVGVAVVNDVLKWLERFQHQISPQSDEAAFRLAMQYPFRAGAAKAIVAVRSDQLEYTNVFKFMRSHLMAALTEFEGASLHMIAPVKDLVVEGVPAEKLVGFNSRIIATTEGKDAKKRQKLKFKNDMGIDFVLQNNGWVFAAQNFEAINSDDQRKAYLNQITSSIADTLFKTEIVSDCKCTKAGGLHAEHKCSTKTSNFVPNKRPKGA